MNTFKKLAPFILGFGGGAILGFMYSSGVKSRLSTAVQTDLTGGKFTVSIDTSKALLGSVADYLKV